MTVRLYRPDEANPLSGLALGLVNPLSDGGVDRLWTAEAEGRGHGVEAAD